MSRISLSPRRSLTLRVVEAYSRRRYGAVLDPVSAYAHHPRALRTLLSFEWRLQRWHALDPALRHLALMVSAARIGCEWCIDFGHWLARDLGLSDDKIAVVPQWRDHPESFTDTELLVMEYAEAMTATPPAVTDALVAELKEHLDDAALVELTVMVAVENLRSRVNSAFGLVGQGFSDRCELPAAP